MALVVKTSPVDIDKRINAFQNYLFANVTAEGMINATDWESYPRAYKNPWKRGNRPELYLASGDYKEVFYDDSFKMTTFFIVDDRRDNSDEDQVKTTVSLIVQADITKLFPSILHRADEELNRAFLSASMNYSLYEEFRFTGLETGVENVYREFITEDSKLDDMSNQYLLRLNYEVRYTPDCCADC